ncbi:DoxX family membrane protein [Chitinophaga sedimenti]|uniref:MauE/DoxX family redox-associated membrane protein n=1 Tax=Chitinophaga sedimenti TaxID=2033606 RepID=UPI002006CB53|nr:MauE/DoxX family redox-associated membrane protein [Chitinophaga sedimenti]MCK7557018.1 DoxX family membrane protein [Chitinophaga sedimenti]
MNHRYLAFALARITLGINFLVHGLVRLPKLEAFRTGMVKGFEGTMMPGALVAPFATVLPFIEFAIGLFLIIGLFTKQSLTACALLMMALLLGTGLKEDWGAAGSQMVYALYIALLLFNLDYNAIAVDTRKKPTSY